MIKLDRLTVGYGKKPVLEEISLTLECGKLIALVGINGSGKTTLLKTAAGMIPPLGGCVSVNGKKLSLATPKERAKQIAYLPQSRSLPDMTVEELVLHGRFCHVPFPGIYSDKDRLAAAGAMKRVGIEDLSGTHLRVLSGGMRQKAYIAMALAQESGHILLDEPATYLDVSQKLGLMKELRQLAAEGKCILAVLHDLTLAMEYADLVAVVHEGRVIRMAPPEEILNANILQTVFSVKITKIEDGEHHAYRYSELN